MRTALLVLAAGCYEHITVPEEPDAPPPLLDTQPATQHCFHPKLLPMICIDTPLRTMYEPATGHLDTNVLANCDLPVPLGGRAQEACVIAAERIQVASPLHVSGSRPLVLLATETIDVSSVLDADSRSLEPGAGQTATCPSAEQGADEVSTGKGTGGGAGGSFGTAGGVGGASAFDRLDGGSIAPIADTMSFDVGQNGGSGGNVTTGGGGGGCGLGGGALYLHAETSVNVTAGAITAFGYGGLAGTKNGAAGGGGGSGGMIVLDGAGVSVASGVVLGATGAGGGGGSGINGTGTQGSAGTASTVATQPMGGSATAPAGIGGHGATQPSATAASGGTANVSGGGGGGGGAGVIRIFPMGTTTAGATIYPPPT